MLAVAARVFPELREPDNDMNALVIGAFTQLCPDTGDTGRGEQLLNLVCDDDVFPDMSRWDVLLATANDAGLITTTLAIQATAPPCSGGLVVVELPGGDTDPVATLQTSFWTDELTLEQAKRFLEPSLWPGCNGFWCTMQPIATSARGNPIYREVVSVACNNPNVWRAETRLEFAMVNLPDGGALVSYDLCEGLPLLGDLIVVDSGSLVVVQEGSGVRVTTTKRILFDHPFSGEALQALSCALGYGAVAEDLVFTSAVAPENQNAGAGTAFPGVDLADPADGAAMKPKQKKAKKKKAKNKSTSPGDEGDAMKDVVDDAVAAAKACIDDFVESYNKSYEKVMAGSYSADDVVQDMAAMWARVARDGATAFKLGLQASSAAAQTSQTRRADDATTAETE